MPSPAGRNVQIPSSIECQTLRATESREKPRDFAFRTDPHHRVKARKRRAGHIKITIRPKGQMIRSHARLQRRKRHRLPDIVYPVDRPSTVAYKQHPVRIKCDSRGDPEVPREIFGLLERRHAIDRAVVAARDEHLALWAECDAGRVYNVGQKRLALTVAGDLVHRHRHLLPSRSRKSCVERAVIAIVGRVGDWMQVLTNLVADYK